MTGDLLYRFTLSHDQAGSQVISEPQGWIDIKMIIDRHEEYMSLIELFEVPMNFYGSNGTHDGGRDFILAVESGYGIGERIGIVVEVSDDGGNSWETLWDGLLNLETLKETDDRTIQLSLLREDVWSKFINRIDTPVDIQSTVDLDNNAIDAITPENTLLTGQIVRFYGDYEWSESTNYPDGGGEGMQLDWDTIIKDDIKKFNVPRFRVSLYTEDGLVYNPSTPQFEAPWDGEYEIDSKLIIAEFFDSAIPPQYGSGTTINVYLLRANQPITNALRFTKTVIIPGGDSTYGLYELTTTLTLQKGDQFVITGNTSDKVIVFGTNRYVYKTECRLATTSNITLSGEQNIDGEMTSSDYVLVKNQGDAAENGIYLSDAGIWTRAADLNTAAEMVLAAVYVTDGDTQEKSAWKQTAEVGIIDVDPNTWEFFISSYERTVPYDGPLPVENYVRITALTTYPDSTVDGFLLHDVGSEIIKRVCQSELVSDYLGSTSTQSRAYDENGCEWNHMLYKGLHLRGYEVSEKAFFQSFKEWWNGANPIFNLGLSYDTLDGDTVIRCEEKSYFFDPDPIINLSWVNNIVRYHDKDHIFKKISLGYEKWQAEEVSGIDDPQTKKTYATKFETIGTDKTLYSKFIAASLAIEVTRRKNQDLTTDYKFDNDTFILAVKPGELASPSGAYLPELDENFDSVTDINDPETRYNFLLTPLRNFFRWMNYFNGALQKNLSSAFKFSSGEGNYLISSQYDCESGPKAACPGMVCEEVGEQDDLVINDFPEIGYLFTPETLEFSYPLSWADYKLIRDNRTKAIGVSKTDENHMICFIKRLEYDINESHAKFVVWKR
jgi:hypothetical protein